jgi:2-hydroxy-3-oxopropionate reductase
MGCCTEMTEPRLPRSTSDTPLEVGFVGLGVMGRPMATRIIDAGFPLTVHSRSAIAVAELVAAGARAAASPAVVARRTDVVIVMVPDAPDLEAVLDGAQGILGEAHDGLVVAAMGTHHPAAMPPLARYCAERGVTLLDAPVSGGEVGANEGSLSIMVGGDAAAFERARPVFETMGRTIVHVGASGAGQLAKACNQLIVGATIAAVAEGLSLARAAGVDPAVVRLALTGGFATSRVLEIHGERMIQHNFTPGGRAALHAKDAHIILDTAAKLGLALPVFSVVADQFDQLVAAGGGELDHSALITLLEGRQASQNAAIGSQGIGRVSSPASARSSVDQSD